jgi:aspartate carbamoyltransferase regulatory subunit
MKVMSYDSSREELKIKKIQGGTVIDHITMGHALDVLRILGITGKEGYIVSVLMNVPSKKLKKKDIVKIEGRELKPEEVDKIALIAAHATINIIRDFQVAEKKEVKLPQKIYGIIKCANPSCITNSREPVKPIFLVDEDGSLKLRCHYCGRIMEKGDFLKQF